MKNLPYIDWRLIDPLISPMINKLNEKGYFTIFCCESHSDDPHIQLTKKIYSDDPDLSFSCDRHLNDKHIYFNIIAEPTGIDPCCDAITGYEASESSSLENNAYIKFGFGYEELWYDFASVYDNFDCMKAVKNMMNIIDSNEKYKEMFRLSIGYESVCLYVKPLLVKKNIHDFMNDDKLCIDLLKKRKKDVLNTLNNLVNDLPVTYDF